MSSSDSRSGGSSGGLPEHSATALSASGSFARGAESSNDPMIGQVIDDRYRIVARLGEGGMGEVYAAEHIHIGKNRAIKILRPEIVSNEEAVSRFRQEARSAASIGHKNIIGIEDFGSLEDGRIYLCMELLEGQPLNEMLDGSIDPGRLINILIQTGHGLAAAHSSGIVHRDMKPENIFVTSGDVPKLLDFGIAKVSQGEGENHLTKTGTIFGTPFYMAPEQALGQPVDQRADIYAIGVIMYECFCGSVPFQGESFMGILTQHITTEPRPPEEVAHEHGRVLPPGVSQVISRCMAKDPGHRYQTMDDLVEALIAIYRVVAGAGMSAYLDAHVPYVPLDNSASQPVAQPPHGSAEMSASSSALLQSSSGHVAPVAAAVPGQSSSAVPQRRSRGWLMVLVVFLFAGAGAGGFVFYQQGRDTAQTAKRPTKVSPPNSKQPVDSPDNPLAVGAADAGAVIPAATMDAAVADEADAAPAEAEAVHVLVYSEPQEAAVHRDGKKIGKTPMNFRVIPGEPVELTLKRRRFKDKTVVIDGSELRVQVPLDRIRRTSAGNGKNGGDGKDRANGEDGKDKDRDTKPPPPARCSPAWCSMPQNENAGCCQLE